MNNEQFDTVIRFRCDQIVSVLSKKAAEYARGDRLSNFKEAAKIQKCTPEQACFNFMMKHIVSILDIVHDLDDGRLPTELIINEKIGDAINYLILLDALFWDRFSQSPRMKSEIEERIDELDKNGKVK